MKIVFFGLGSIGVRHAQLLQRKYSHELFAFRSNTARNNTLGIKEIYTWLDFEKVKPDIAFITNPTHLHIKTALQCAKMHCHLFIEKPIGHTAAHLNDLIQTVQKNQLVAYIAYNLRFHPVLRVLREHLEKNVCLHMRVVCTSYLPLWKPQSNHQASYSSHRRMGGGVLLDLSHEIDYTSYLLGKIIHLKGDYGRGSDVTHDSEDYGDLYVKCENGRANIHINYFGHYYQRSIQLDFPNYSLHADLIDSTIVEYKKGKITKRYKFDCDKNYTYEHQLDYFFKNLSNPTLMNNILEASRLYKKIIQLKKIK